MVFVSIFYNTTVSPNRCQRWTVTDKDLNSVLVSLPVLPEVILLTDSHRQCRASKLPVQFSLLVGVCPCFPSVGHCRSGGVQCHERAVHEDRGRLPHRLLCDRQGQLWTRGPVPSTHTTGQRQVGLCTYEYFCWVLLRFYSLKSVFSCDLTTVFSNVLSLQ